MKIIRPPPNSPPSHRQSSRFLNPGDFYFGNSDDQIQTILGSCIAITLWHPKLHIGGMCHFVMPKRPSSEQPETNPKKLDGRYADDAMVLFQNEALSRGTKLHDYQAKIFGGGNMQTHTAPINNAHIGHRNTEAALKHLAKKHISWLVAHVGETGARRITFNIQSGDVWVKHEPLPEEKGASQQPRKIQ